MRKVLVNRIPVWCIAVLAVVLISSTVAFGVGEPMHGVLENNTLLAYASTSGSGGNSGRIWSAEGIVERLGTVHVLARASWDWSSWRNNASTGDNTEHPSAVVNRTPIKFSGCRSTSPPCAAPNPAFNEAIYSSLPIDTTQSPVTFPGDHDLTYSAGKVRRGHPNPFVADATVIITARNGDVIFGWIDDGSVTELVVHTTGGGSINEWFIGFKIDSTNSSGRFAGATGRGHIHKIFDSGSGYSDTAGVTV